MTLHQVIHHQLQQLKNLEQTLELAAGLVENDTEKVVDMGALCETLATIEREMSDEILDWLDSNASRYPFSSARFTKPFGSQPPIASFSVGQRGAPGRS